MNVSACLEMSFKETDIDGGNKFRARLLLFLSRGTAGWHIVGELASLVWIVFSFSSVVVWERAVGRLSDRTSMAKRSSSVISKHVSIVINCESRGGGGTFCHLVDALLTWQLKDERRAKDEQGRVMPQHTYGGIARHDLAELDVFATVGCLY